MGRTASTGGSRSTSSRGNNGRGNNSGNSGGSNSAGNNPAPQRPARSGSSSGSNTPTNVYRDTFNTSPLCAKDKKDRDEACKAKEDKEANKFFSL